MKKTILLVFSILIMGCISQKESSKISDINPYADLGEDWSVERKLELDYPMIFMGHHNHLSTNSSVLRLSNGDIWLVTNFDESKIMRFISKDDGKNWSEMEIISEDGERGFKNTIFESTDGRVWIVWTTGNIHIKNFYEGKWSEELIIEKPEHSFLHDSSIIVEKDNKIYVFWIWRRWIRLEDKESFSDNLWYISTEDGKNWTEPERIDVISEIFEKGIITSFYIVLLGNDKFLLMWSDMRYGPDPEAIFYSTSDDLINWSQPKLFYTSDTSRFQDFRIGSRGLRNFLNHVLVTKDGRVFVVWSEYIDDSCCPSMTVYRILYSVSYDNFKSWSEPKPILSNCFICVPAGSIESENGEISTFIGIPEIDLEKGWVLDHHLFQLSYEKEKFLLKIYLSIVFLVVIILIGFLIFKRKRRA